MTVRKSHRWDLGRALGQEVTWTDAEMDRIEAGIGEAPRRARVLALLGRRA